MTKPANTYDTPHPCSAAETITGVRFAQREEAEGGALVLEVAEGMGFTVVSPSPGNDPIATDRA